MKQNVYISGAEPQSGKSLIALALMERLSSRTEKVGFFRPVIRDGKSRDSLIHLISTRYQLELGYDEMYGCTTETARQLISADRYDELLKLILEKYKVLEKQCERIVCTGTDFTGVPSALEFDFNADVANNLGCLMVPVVRGFRRSPSEIVDATTTFEVALQERHCDIFAVVINRVGQENTGEVSELIKHAQTIEVPIYVIPEEPSLGKPTIGDISWALNAECIYGDAEALNRVVMNYKVAAMELPDFLDHIDEGSLIITPGDRSDIILGSLISYPSAGYPQIAGLLLTGNLTPATQVTRLIEGLGTVPVAVLNVATDTFTTAMHAHAVPPVLTPDNERKIAAALGTVEKSIDLEAFEQRLATTRSTRITPLMFEHELIQTAKANLQRIVLPEGSEERILRASEILTLRGVAELTLLGDPDEIGNIIKALGLSLDQIQIVDPQRSPWREQFAESYFKLRQHKGISRDMAYDAMVDVCYFGTMMVYHDLADGMVSGSAHTTQHTIRPAFEFIRAKPDVSIVSSVFFMCLEDRVLVYGDCAVNPNPTAEQLADIAITSATTARSFGIEPRIAMLSYSTGDSGKGDAVDKVKEATRIAKRKRPDLQLEGPIQYDAAVDASVAKTKLPGSDVAGKATIFIFPDLNTGNNTYKAVQRSAGAIAVGPILQGLNKPVNDLSRGCTVTDIVNTVAITAIQAQGS